MKAINYRTWHWKYPGGMSFSLFTAVTTIFLWCTAIFGVGPKQCFSRENFWHFMRIASNLKAFSTFLFKLPQRKNPAMLLFQCTGLKLSIAQMKNDWMNKRGISIWQKCTRWSWTNAAFFPASGNYCSTNLSLDYYHKKLEVILSRSVFHTQIICFCVWGSRSSAYFSGQLFYLAQYSTSRQFS